MLWQHQKHLKSQTSAIISTPHFLVSDVNFVVNVDDTEIILRWDETSQTFFIVQDSSADNTLMLSKPVWCTGLVVKSVGDGRWHITFQIPYGAENVSIYINDHISEYHPQKIHVQNAISSRNEKREVRSSITGRVVQVNVKSGDVIKEKACLVIVEAMKMENKIFAPCSGVVERVDVLEGDGIAAGKVLCMIKESR